MASVSKLVERMVYWCTEANLGYDQSNRQDIRVGGECDCSSLVIHCLKEAGFDTGSASYTGNMSSNLCARGWSRMPNNGSPQYGDILLNDNSHVAVYIGNGMLAQASIDENGRISGGQAGDQTDYETNVRSYYNKPWDCYLRYTAQQSSAPSGGTNVSINELAQKVINGEFGNGDDRRRALGDKYDAVQARVNELLNGTPAAPSGGSTNSSVPAGTYKIQVSSLCVRTGPGTNYDSVAAYGAGQTVILDGWSAVAGGYVWGRYIGASSGQYRYIAVRTTAGVDYAKKI